MRVRKEATVLLLLEATGSLLLPGRRVGRPDPPSLWGGQTPPHCPTTSVSLLFLLMLLV